MQPSTRTTANCGQMIWKSAPRKRIACELAMKWRDGSSHVSLASHSGRLSMGVIPPDKS